MFKFNTIGITIILVYFAPMIPTGVAVMKRVFENMGSNFLAGNRLPQRSPSI